MNKAAFEGPIDKMKRITRMDGLQRRRLSQQIRPMRGKASYVTVSKSPSINTNATDITPVRAKAPDPANPLSTPSRIHSRYGQPVGRDQRDKARKQIRTNQQGLQKGAANDLATAAAGFKSGYTSPLTGTSLDRTKKKIAGNTGSMAKGVAAGATPTQGNGVGRPDRMASMSMDRPAPAFGKTASARAFAAGYMFKMAQTWDAEAVRKIIEGKTPGGSDQYQPEQLQQLADKWNKDIWSRTLGTDTGQAVSGIGLGATGGAAIGGMMGGGKGAMMGGGIGAMLSALVPIIFPDYKEAFVWLQNAIRRGTVERDLKAINSKIDEAKDIVPETKSEKDVSDAAKAADDKAKAEAEAAQAQADADAQAAADQSRASTPAATSTPGAAQTPGAVTPPAAPAAAVSPVGAMTQGTITPATSTATPAPAPAPPKKKTSGVLQ